MSQGVPFSSFPVPSAGPASSSAVPGAAAGSVGASAAGVAVGALVGVGVGACVGAGVGAGVGVATIQPWMGSGVPLLGFGAGVGSGRGGRPELRGASPVVIEHRHRHGVLASPPRSVRGTFPSGMSWNVAAPSASAAVSFWVSNQMSFVSEPASISTSRSLSPGVSPMSPVWVTLITIPVRGVSLA